MAFSESEVLNQYDTESGIGNAYIFAANWIDIILVVLFGFEKIKCHPGLLCYGLDFEKDNSLNQSFKRRVFSTFNSALNNTSDTGIRVLDMGCGLGGATFMLAQKYPNILFDGITLSLQQKNKAQKRVDNFNIHNTRYYSGNYLATKFVTNSYDAITATETFCYIPLTKKITLAEEVSRLLKPGGKIVISDGYFTTKGLKSFENNPKKRSEFHNIAYGWGLPARLSLVSETILAFENAGLKLISKNNQTDRIIQFSKFIRRRAKNVLPFVKIFLFLDRIFKFSTSIKSMLGFTSDFIYKFAYTSIMQTDVFINGDIEYIKLVLEKPKP